MPDVFTKAKRSQVMSRIRGRGNKETEIALARLLRQNKISGWRRHRRVVVERRKSKAGGKTPSGHRRSTLVFRLTVRPDFVFAKSRTAVFVDGCFWHGCPRHCRMPKGNRAFWKKKLSDNKVRDRLVTRTLRRDGWRVLRIWEHELVPKNLPRLRLRLCVFAPLR
jgi:DNA mismatch endonuclease (patch repair protein)